MKKIVLIEDDVAVRENTAELLELNNYTVLTAPNGRQGLERVKQELPDIVVCDIMMPEMDGYTVLEQLSTNAATRHIPFIFLSAKTEHKDIRRGMDMGADDYLTKPFEEEELISAIESRLAKAEILKEWDPSPTPEHPDKLRSLKDLSEYLDREGEVFTFRKNEAIYEQGKRANYFYLIKKGVVKTHQTDAYGKELITFLYRPGDFFGYTSFMQHLPYQESATAIENTELRALTKDDFKNLLQENRKVTLELVELLSDSLNEVKEQLLQMAYGSVRKKTAATILQFVEKMDKTPGEGIRISRNDLASVAGIATESLIRTISSFSKEGLIEIEGRNIKILDLEELKEVE